jgi:LPS export ABC transporter permease LptG
VPTLWRYVTIRFVAALLASVTILALVVLVVDMLLNLDEIFEAQETLGGAIRFLLVRNAALYLPYLIPVATFTAAFFAVGNAARHHEIVAIKAGGVSPIQALAPLFAVSVLIAGLSLVLTETITTRSTALLRSMGDRDGSGQISLRSGTIWYHTGRFVYNIRNPDAAGEGVDDIHVYERDERGRLLRRVHAVHAVRLAPNRWRFEDATVRVFDPDDPVAPPRIERAEQIELALSSDRSPRLLQEELGSLPLWELADYVGAVLESGGDPGRARAQLHARLSGPLLAVLFALLAVPLGLKVETTRNLALPALQGVGLLFVFLLAREYGMSFSRHGALSAALVPWTVLAVFFVWGSFQLARVPR